MVEIFGLASRERNGAVAWRRVSQAEKRRRLARASWESLWNLMEVAVGQERAITSES